MSKYKWGALQPEQVSEWINFDCSNPDWHYEGIEATSMASRQAEGVAYLWNQLAIHGVALLADEVGMGKTLQGLGVAAMLWKMKPDAKVLVMAPNRDICAHWRREYHGFVSSHYRPVDHCVKNGADGGPVQSIQRFMRLEELAAGVEANAAHLYLTTIHALSGLVPAAEKGRDNNSKAKAHARRIHQRIKEALSGHGFDLIIIDEAHYFRNRSGDSQRVNAAQAFFGEPSAPLSEKILLLTATPSHSSPHDVRNILSYFLRGDEDIDHSAQALMQKYGLRRFRRMRGANGHYTKREYRCEKAMPCDFKERPGSEMFFALYQKKLVTDLKLTRNNKSLVYGFLEGFESVGLTGNDNKVGSEATVEFDEDTGKDFSKAKDTDLLAWLTEQYYSAFGHYPDHPKYGQLVEECLPDELFTAPRNLHEDKHLVFVRRIPSVHELTQRINQAYDAILAQQIYQAWGLQDDDPDVKRWRAKGWSRGGFDKLMKKVKTSRDEEDEEFDGEDNPPTGEGKDTDYGSVIADLFVVKQEKGNRTDCANVSLRFRKPESAFAMFLEPSSDYLLDGYTDYYEYTQSGKNRADYVTAARTARLKRHDLLTQKAESSKREYVTKRYQRKVTTVWTMLYQALPAEQKEMLEAWADKRPDVAENFANYVKTGFLFASPVMVELYAWFTIFNRENSGGDVQKKYADFLNFVRPRLSNSLLLAYFKNALSTFEVLCEKITDHKLGEWEKDWRVLTSLQNPAWYASGQSGNRQRLILGFNSPFYPNVLVATSVFQEGVNLHLQCRKVHHYGLAGSPGDNEQRIGRVDRLFGKVNELLKVDGMAELEINYPFLKNSVDEDQVASFVARKFRVEEKMDACIQEKFDHTVTPTRENWVKFLREPVKSITIRDPYAASFDKRHMPTSRYTPFDNHENSAIDNHIAALLADILDAGNDRLFTVGENQHNPNALFLIDPIVKHEGKRRRQPILISKHFSAEFSALVSGTVYFISLTSPLVSKDELKSLCSDVDKRLASLGEEVADHYPLVRMAIDPDAAMSHFYLHCRVDLAIFVGIGQMSMLSRDELMAAVSQLRDLSDRLEYELFSGTRDLQADELKLAAFLSERKAEGGKPHKRHSATMHDDRWEHLSTPQGAIERLSHRIAQKDFDETYFSEKAAYEYENATPAIKTLLLNDQMPFLRFKPVTHDYIQASLNYPAGDIQAEERLLLERWFDYAVLAHRASHTKKARRRRAATVAAIE